MRVTLRKEELEGQSLEQEGWGGMHHFCSDGMHHFVSDGPNPSQEWGLGTSCVRELHMYVETHDYGNICILLQGKPTVDNIGRLMSILNKHCIRLCP